MNTKIAEFLESFLDDFSRPCSSITEKTDNLFADYLTEKALLEFEKDKQSREMDVDAEHLFKDDRRGQLVKHNESGMIGAVIGYDPLVWRAKGEVELAKGKRWKNPKNPDPRPAVDFYGDDGVMGDVRVFPVVDGQVKAKKVHLWYAGDYEVLDGQEVNIDDYVDVYYGERRRPEPTGVKAKYKPSRPKTPVAQWKEDPETGKMVLSNPEDFDEETRKQLMSKDLPTNMNIDTPKWRRAVDAKRKYDNDEDLTGIISRDYHRIQKPR